MWDEICCDTGNLAKVVCEELPKVTCDTTDPNYHNIEGRCFYFGNVRSTYGDAELDCIDRGGRLFEPKNEEANIRIYQEAKSVIKLPFWIGINEITSNGM